MLFFVMQNKDNIAGCIANAIGYTLYDVQATAFGEEYYPPEPKNKVDKASVAIYKFTKKVTNGELTVDDINIDDLENMQKKLESVANKAVDKLKNQK
jgi:hypothetical protein